MIEQNMILYRTSNGYSMYKDFSDWNEIESEFEYLRAYTTLKGAVLKGKLWSDDNGWDALERKLKRMCWNG